MLSLFVFAATGAVVTTGSLVTTGQLLSLLVPLLPLELRLSLPELLLPQGLMLLLLSSAHRGAVTAVASVVTGAEVVTTGASPLTGADVVTTGAPLSLQELRLSWSFCYYSSAGVVTTGASVVAAVVAGASAAQACCRGATVAVVCLRCRWSLLS